MRYILPLLLFFLLSCSNRTYKTSYSETFTDSYKTYIDSLKNEGYAVSMPDTVIFDVYEDKPDTVIFFMLKKKKEGVMQVRVINGAYEIKKIE